MGIVGIICVPNLFGGTLVSGTHKGRPYTG